MTGRTRCSAAALALLALSVGCQRQTTREARGESTLVRESWTQPGPCPKHFHEDRLEDSDGRVVLENAKHRGTSPDGVWSLWEGGESGSDTFALDQRNGALVPIPWTYEVLPEWWCPNAQRIVLVRSIGAQDRVLLLDLSGEQPATRELFATRVRVGSVAWAPDGTALALVQSGGSESDPRVLLSEIRTLESPELEPIDDQPGPASSYAIAWEGGQPRLARCD